MKRDPSVRYRHRVRYVSGCHGPVRPEERHEFVVRVPALPFAVGLYLPLSAMTPVFLGGVTRLWLEKRYPAGGQTREEQESDPERLLGAGFIAGEGLIGVAGPTSTIAPCFTTTV